MSFRNSPVSLAAKVILLAAPAVLLFALVLRHGVDVPVQDQWDGFLPLLERADAGTLRAGDFFALHNEHRHGFPRLALFALAQATGWDIRAELIFNTVLLLLAGINLGLLARATGWRVAGAGGWLMVGMSLLLFTVQQYENLLWGFQAGFLMPLVWVTALPWVLLAQRPLAAFAGAIVLPVLATFSIASGMLLWPLAALLLSARGDLRGWSARTYAWAAWGVAAVASIAAYLHGYTPPAHHVSVVDTARAPLAVLHYALAFIGAPFASDRVGIAVASGAVIALSYIACVVAALRSRHTPEAMRRAWPWLALAGFAFAQAGMTALGRAWLGPASALASRYESIAVLAPIGLLFAIPVLRGSCPPQRRALRIAARLGPAVLVTTAGALFLASSLTNLQGWRYTQEARWRARGAIHFSLLPGSARLLGKEVRVPAEFVTTSSYTSDQVRQGDHASLTRALEKNASWLRERILFLQHTGRLRRPVAERPNLRPLLGASPPVPAAGAIDWFGKTDPGTAALAGWARLPKQDRPADVVLVTYDNLSADPVVLHVVAGNGRRPPRPDGGAAEPFPGSSWIAPVPLDSLPPYPTALRVWAYDADTHTVHPLAEAVPPELVSHMRSSAP